MTDCEFEALADEGREQSGQEWAIERLVDMDDWQDWLCGQAKKRKSPAQFVDWLYAFREVLDSYDPEVGPEVSDRAGECRIDEGTFCVHWVGESCTLGNTDQFRFLNALAKCPERYHSHAWINEQMARGESEKLAHIKSRLCSVLRGAKMSELAKCIKADIDHYGLFFQRP